VLIVALFHKAFKNNKLQRSGGDMKIKPLADRVVIKPAAAEEKTKGGIILPDTAKEKPVVGEVMAVGPGKVTDDGKKLLLEVKVGDKVLYGKYSGTEVTLDGEEFLIMREADIFAIV
jgi:chaperonin GroES